MTDQQNNLLIPKSTASQNLQTSDEQQSKLNESHLSQKETRQIVTPYAFFVADELLGTPLARPMRRGMAMGVDLICIALLTQVSSLILATVAAATFFKAGNRLKTKKRFNALRIFLRLLVAILLFMVAFEIFDEINSKSTLNNDNSSNNIDKELNGMEVIAVTAKTLLKTKNVTEQINQGDCEPAFKCVQQLGEEIVSDVVNLGGQEELLKDVIEGYSERVSEVITAEEKKQLQTQLNSFAKTQLSNVSPLISSETQSIDLEKKILSSEHDIEAKLAPEGGSVKTPSETKGLLGFLEDTLDEFGLGLGWAAFYFSVFTAWWKGQTPGKKLVGIKVIKLDNQPLNLWESFGRYGGYAAGFATGLSGFLQVLWDPNRQAIQDKISETLVIDLRRPKVPFIKGSEDKS